MDKSMKNLRLLIIAIFLVAAAIFLGDFFINRGHPYNDLVGAVSCLLVSAVFIVSSLRSSNK